MVSHAAKRFWKGVALGLALSPLLGYEGVSQAQSTNQASTVAAVRESGSAAPANDVETVRQLVREGRKALSAGDKAQAEKLARQAVAMKVSLPFWETDTPEKLLIDIGVKSTPPPAGAMGKPSAAKAATIDPHVLVKRGYEALQAGKLDEAQKLAQQAHVAPNAKWGLFEDTPTKLLSEIQKARVTRDKEESVKVLASARKAYEQGKYDEAEKLAYKANNLHGPYSLWDFSDKPDKLIAEIQTAREKTRRAKVPPVPGTSGTATAKNGTSTPSNTAKTGTPGTPTSVASGKTTTSKSAPTEVAKSTPAPSPSWPAEAKPVEPTTVAAAAAQVPVPVPAPVPALPTIVQANAAPAPVPAMPAAVNVAKVQAQQCLTEGKNHLAAQRYFEAREKFQEAQRYQAEYLPGEETPDQCLMTLASAVVKHVDGVVKEASAPEAAATYETRLQQARSLASGFGLDTAAIDTRLSGMKSTAVATVKTATADAMVQGQSILDKARLELKRGQTEIARQLAVEVYNGPFGIQAEATQLMRSIDVEEHNQRVLAANRNFDAGLAAYRGKDFGQALAILRQVDASLLAPEKKNQLKDTMLACSKADTAGSTVAALPAAPKTGEVVQATGTGAKDAPVQQVSATKVAGLQGSKPTMTPGEGDSLSDQVKAMQEIEFQRLRAEGLDMQSKALQQFERGETDAALETLDGYLKRVKNSRLDSASITRLCRPIEAKIQSFKLVKAQKDLETNVVRAKDRFLEGKSKEVQAELKKQQQVKDLMKQFNTLYKEGKYQEAELIAAKAHELDPDDPATEAAVKLAQIHGNVTSYAEIRERKEKMFVKGMDDAEDVGPAVDMKKPLSIDMPTLKVAKGREKDKNGISVMKNLSDKEREIQSKLSKQVTVNFHNVPLTQAIDDLRAMSGMNIHLETQALAAESITAEQPVSLKVDNISLKAALKVLLDQAHLTYMIQDEMLKVTTEKAARGKLMQKVYSVADLVIPIDDYTTPSHMNLQHAMERVVDQQRINLNGGGATPFTNNRFSLQNGQPVGSGSGQASMSTQGGSQASMSTQPGNIGSPMAYNANVSPTKQSMQDMLIKLITNTVAPQSWAEVGGAGTIDYMPIGMALVVNQTPDVQEQVADLLEALRRLQDLEVAVEVRMITLAETFFERIGLDFALNVKTDHSTERYEPMITTNNFKPAGQVNDFSPRNMIAGLRPGGIIGNQTGNTGSLTGDLDIPIRSSSFQYAIPPFAYPNNPGFNGGLSMGLAFLSDIQVYMFMEAAQGDRRTNVMQAPKLTLFNGQTSTINVNDQQFFVTNVNVVGFGGQIVFVPINNPVPLGIQLAIQAVVSADRRFVRLNLAPTMSNLASAIVPLFPVTTFITPVFEGGAQGQPIPFTQFIQQPNISTIQIQTTVSIPDGGTVILGGLKTLSEGRNEFGPPVLSKLPYVNRLFKNVGYGREAQSLLLMVTPRIIINSEEEERQTGVISTQQISP